MGKKSKVSLKTQIVLFAWLLLYFLPPHLPSPLKICRAGFCSPLPFTWQKKCFCGLIPPSLPTACVPLPQGFLCGAHWGMQVLGQVCLLGMVLSCQMSCAWPPVLSAKMAAWFKTIYPTSKSSQREHEMNLHVCFLLYFTLCSWLLFCYSLVWHLSMPAALVLHNHQIPNYCSWCCDAIYTCHVFWSGTHRHHLSPGLCLVTLGWSALQWLESPSPHCLFFASLPLSSCRWANTCIVECERKVGPCLKGSCFGFNWHNGEWCQFVWHCMWHSQFHVSLISGFCVHTQCCFNLGFLFS